MTLKIEKTVQPGFTIFILSGHLAEEEMAELETEFGPRTYYSKIIIDLKDLRLANRAAVKFLARCEADGLRIENCPGYIREWMLTETSK
ncbi:MAG TPA: hypothetical protein VF783_01935 [Terriglobales bacterium]